MADLRWNREIAGHFRFYGAQRALIKEKKMRELDVVSIQAVVGGTPELLPFPPPTYPAFPPYDPGVPGEGGVIKDWFDIEYESVGP